jgi:hypothetical protein
MVGDGRESASAGASLAGANSRRAQIPDRFAVWDVAVSLEAGVIDRIQANRGEPSRRRGFGAQIGARYVAYLRQMGIGPG